MIFARTARNAFHQVRQISAEHAAAAPRLLAGRTGLAVMLAASLAAGFVSSTATSRPAETVARELKGDRLNLAPKLPPLCADQTWPNYSEMCVSALKTKQDRQRSGTFAFARPEGAAVTSLVLSTPAGLVTVRSEPRREEPQGQSGTKGTQVALRALP